MALIPQDEVRLCSVPTNDVSSGGTIIRLMCLVLDITANRTHVSALSSASDRDFMVPRGVGRWWRTGQEAVRDRITTAS
jgi:hypothetical protein